jgi:hypothetical protein
MNTKFLSFEFTIPNWHINPAYKVTVPFVINVHYAFHWNKKVDVQAFYVKPGMGKLIVNWEKLEEEIRLAAENNSKMYKVPGEGGGFKYETDPLRILELEERQIIKQKY